MKTLQVIHGPKDNPTIATVPLMGVLRNSILTPKMARQAARIAAGHCQGVKVMDTEQGRGYILYSDKRNSHRRFEVDGDEQPDICPECNATGTDVAEHEYGGKRTLHCLKCGEGWEIVAR